MPTHTNERAVIIDCHCHTFNANDLPIFGFLNRVVLNADEEVLPKLVLPLARVLSKLTHSAPGARQELRKIAELLGEPYIEEAPEEGVTEAVPGREDEGEPDDAQFMGDLREAIQELESSAREEDRNLLLHLEKETGVEKSDENLEAFPVDLAKAIWEGGGVAARYLKWVKLLTKYRYKITERLINTYSTDEEAVDLFTPALIDYDRWVDDRAVTSLPSQIALMEGNIRLHKGRIHPFFPVDPWRAAYTPGPSEGPLTWLRQAVEQHGFVGAKLYPPMGYSAIDNAGHSSFPPNAPDATDVFGARLDEALQALYAYCAGEDIPLLTHCADSNEVQDEFGERAGPAYWERVVQDYPLLRINLGHFGDLDTLSTGDGWAWKVGQLLNESSTHVYADVSHHSAILEKEGREKTIENLKRLFDRYPAAKDRIMFGTDWIMLARVKNHARFLIEFRDAFQYAFGTDVANKFMGLNAVKFLGLRPGDKTRQRLDLFYARHGIPTPSWANAI